MASTKTFTDLDLNFTAHPLSRDISKRTNENAVKASVRNLILTSYYERPFRSDIGSPLRQLLFELPGPMTKELIKRSITDTISNFEPRAQIISVEVKFNTDNNSVDVVIQFKVLNGVNVTTLELTLERTR